MRWVLVVLAALVIIIVVAFTVGVLLPREHRAASSVLVKQPVEVVWSSIRQMGNIPSFWTEVLSSDRSDVEGVEGWTQSIKGGFTMRLVIEQERPPVELVTRIVATAGDPFGGRWIYHLEPVPAGTQLTITEDGWVGSPIFRLVSRVTGYHKTLDGYLGALSRKFNEDVKPAHVPPQVPAN